MAGNAEEEAMETRRNLYARDAELAVAIAGLANHHVSPRIPPEPTAQRAALDARASL